MNFNRSPFENKLQVENGNKPTSIDTYAFFLCHLSKNENMIIHYIPKGITG
jgi:hypothetical protein